MQPPLFLIDRSSVDGSSITLDKTESHHAFKVMRLRTGALVIAVDGLGTAYRCEITKATGKSPVELSIHSTVRNFGEPKVQVTLAAGLSTNSKFETVVEKATELGVRRIVPLLTEKSKITLDDPKRISTKSKRYTKVATAAVKQCRRSYLPDITTPRQFSAFMRELDPATPNLLFDPSPPAKNLSSLSLPADCGRITLIVGPESGFSPDELALALEHQAIPISLGERILRTETAGPVVTALVMHLLGEFS